MKIVKEHINESLGQSFSRGGDDKLKNLGVGRIAFHKKQIENVLETEVFDFEMNEFETVFAIDMNNAKHRDYIDPILKFRLSYNNILTCLTSNVSLINKMIYPDKIKSLDDLKNAVFDEVSWEEDED